MPKCEEVKSYYKKKGWPLVCYLCGSTENLTKDHIKPRCRIPVGLRAKLWRRRFKNPEKYYAQFALCCQSCNMIKGTMTEKEFLKHVIKILKYRYGK